MENEKKNQSGPEAALEAVLPGEIEKRSFAIIGQELKERGIVLDPETALVVKRVIHTTADFDYAENLVFSPGAMEAAKEAIRQGAPVVTDTQMAKAGINKKALARFGCPVYCFMSDSDVAEAAARQGTTRAWASMDKAAALGLSGIYAIGNAPTALIRLRQLMMEGAVRPRLIIAAPVGFVNVVQAKELIVSGPAPYIAARGRKGGSNVAAAVCNALLYDVY